jgi:MIP family channel proteins
VTAPLSRRLAAEALGTLALVGAGCGAVVVDGEAQALGPVGVALAFGLVVFVAVASLGPVSGAHINPAVTCAFALVGRFPWREVPAYVAAQAVGGTFGAILLRLLFGTAAGRGVTVPSGTEGQSLGLEVLLTATLMFVIAAVASDERAVRPLAAPAIGATVALGALWGGPISGASMNPARSLGPALAAGAWTSHWIYWVGPLAGAALGVLAHRALRPATPVPVSAEAAP